MSKRQYQREVAIKLMKDHFKLTGINLYFRNAIYHVIKDHIEDAVRSLENDGTVTRVKVKGAVAYKLKEDMLNEKEDG